MKDILRIQFRQALKQKGVPVAGFLVNLTGFAFLMMDSGDIGETPKTATESLPEMLYIFAAIALFVGAMIIGQCCGSDFTDHTINHEALAGRSRAAIYFGRAIPALILAPLSVLLISILPFILYGFVHGWGNTVPVSVLMQRTVLAVFPLLRISSFWIFILFIFRHPVAPVIAAFPAFVLSLGFSTGLEKIAFFELIRKIPCLLSCGNLIDLLRIKRWEVYNLSLEQFFTYDFAMAGTYIVQTVGISLAMSAVYLLLGYHFFHLDDMH